MKIYTQDKQRKRGRKKEKRGREREREREKYIQNTDSTLLSSEKIPPWSCMSHTSTAVYSCRCRYRFVNIVIIV